MRTTDLYLLPSMLFGFMVLGLGRKARIPDTLYRNYSILLIRLFKLNIHTIPVNVIVNVSSERVFVLRIKFTDDNKFNNEGKFKNQRTLNALSLKGNSIRRSTSVKLLLPSCNEKTNADRVILSRFDKGKAFSLQFRFGSSRLFMSEI